MESDKIYKIILTVLAGEETQEEHEQLSAWLNESEENRREYSQIERLYQLSSSSSSKKVSSYYDVEQAWKFVKGQTIDKRKSFIFRKWISYAAMLTLLLTAGMFYLYKQQLYSLSSQVNLEQLKEPILLLDNGETISLDKDTFSIENEHTIIHKKAKVLSYVPQEKEEQNIKTDRKNRLVIPKGKTYELKLSDGTHVWLNSESELIYPTNFTGNTREVILRGEAFFDVAKDASKPFIVENNQMKIKVLGTSFNVSGYVSERLQNVTLVNGSVQVQIDNDSAFRISPSEQFSYDKEKQTTSIQVVNTDLYTAWTEGKYIFKDTRLEDILSKLQRWYDFEIIYLQEELKNRRFSIVINREDNLKDVLEVISFTSNVKLVQENNIIKVKYLEKGGE
ncbi:FecR family protein [Parabacteroides faecis]|uniref:Ferric-dicitrate binding protein FerR (Iron transport regulator) n=1 Tax=Parabacteroides faecis TaxID=1217282 RepID=A0ABR6KFT8_9BACT|nr:FecR domain-containing protein [Parabacteroides faecis]MBB4620371.1 ferric-dicitrate binding protein FerR (iron transport regulator) [Parabacteroides faecis]GGJ96924.1 iron dicitrate transporter FecR [Parabacteroides faecis]